VPGFHNTTGSQNSFFGRQAGFHNTTGYSNSFFGVGAGNSNTDGSGNSFFGDGAGNSNTTGNENSFFGFVAGLKNTTGLYNSFFGRDAGFWNTTGSGNSLVGYQAGVNNTEGGYNTASGYDALYFNTSGSYNTALGMNSGLNSTTGNYNIFLGANVSGTAIDTNTIRIGKPYNASTQEGQNRAYIAGIVETVLTESDAPKVVGVGKDGRLGTFPPVLFLQSPPATQIQPGAAEPGSVSGSMLFLSSGATPPSGYTLLGYTDIELKSAGKRPSSIAIDVYMKQ
jgi:hypothetical protein